MGKTLPHKTRYNQTAKGKATCSRARKVHLKKVQADPGKWLVRKLRVDVSRLLRGGRKCSKLCSIMRIRKRETLMKHLELLWLLGMIWENYGNKAGDWHAGHKIPVDRYYPNNKEDLSRAFCMANMFPQWKLENQESGKQVAAGVRVPKAVFPVAWKGVRM